MNFFCGHDLSLTGTATVILNENKEVVFAETFKNDLRGPERLIFVRDKIQEVMNDCCPIFTCVEDYIMHMQQPGRAFGIGELGGVIRVLMHENGYDYQAISPTAVKKFVAGNGSAKKEHMMMEVLANFGYKSADNNVADAYGLARLAYTLFTDDLFGLTEIQQEVIWTIHNPTVKKPKKPASERKPRKQKAKPTLLRRG